MDMLRVDNQQPMEITEEQEREALCRQFRDCVPDEDSYNVAVGLTELKIGFRERDIRVSGSSSIRDEEYLSELNTYRTRLVKYGNAVMGWTVTEEPPKENE